MVEVYDLSMQRAAILQNAFDRIESEQINAVGSFQFTLPADDPKNQYCKPFWYIRNDEGQLYRIIAPTRTRESIETKTYQCEHVIATLIDDVLFGQHVVGNRGTYTDEVIDYILGHQTVGRWVLDECDFRRQYEYGWENENLLAALFSVPNSFTTPYIWKYDTSRYPWRLSLKAIDAEAHPSFYIRAEKNLLSFEEERAAKDICTKLYCLGYGEGVNQLGISEVNGGKPYLLASQDKIAEYGYITRIFVDRRFENAESLMERGKALLAELSEPTRARTFAVADLYELTGDDLDKAEVGKIARFTLDDTQTYITEVSRNHDIPGDVSITLATKAVDVAQTIADLADRQRIEQVYSQGATQIYAQSIQANATQQVKARLNFYIPAEMRIVNAVKAKISLSAFRSYSAVTSGGGASTATSSSGGGTTATSTSGGATTATSSSGGGGTATSSSGGGTYTATGWGGGSAVTSGSGGYTYTSSSAVTLDARNTYATDGGGYGNANHNHGIYSGRWLLTSNGSLTPSGSVSWVPSGAHEHAAHSHTVEVRSHTHTVNIPNHDHSVSIGAHSHSVTIPAHSHTVTTTNHSHSITIPAHTHTVNIPNHTHSIEQGIFTFGAPSSATLYVDGRNRATVSLNEEMDLTAYLLNENGKIDRGAWHSVEIEPNDKAYITIDLMIQGFIQSRGGNTV